jgi:hypothetical protein
MVIFHDLLFISWAEVQPSSLDDDDDECGAISGMNDWQKDQKPSE